MKWSAHNLKIKKITKKCILMQTDDPYNKKIMKQKTNAIIVNFAFDRRPK